MSRRGALRRASRTRRAVSSRDSAQTAAPRTSGEASASSARQRRDQARLAGIAGGDQHIAQEAVAADALDRRAGKERAECRVVERQQSASAGSRRSSRAASFASDALPGELVPRAGGQAIVAAIDAVADRLAEFVRDRPLVLDGEVGDAAPRIEPVGCREGVGRAGVEAGAAGAAMVLLRRVRLDLGRGEDRAEKQPRAELAADEIGVLALPADAGGFGERLFHDRRGVDEDLHVAAGPGDDAAGDLLQPALDDVVIVAVLRIDGDRAAVALCRGCRADRGPARNSWRAR